jgi:hypothetical protein
MVITALDHVPHCYSAEDGEKLASVLRRQLACSQQVILSLAGVADVPSSFVNAAFVGLLDEFPYPVIRSKLKVIDSNPQINGMIRRCFDNALKIVEAA